MTVLWHYVFIHRELEFKFCHDTELSPNRSDEKPDKYFK